MFTSRPLILLEISTAMQFTFSSKAVRTIGLASLLSMTVGLVAQAKDCPNASKVETLALATKPAQAGTIVDIAAGNPSFSTLVTAVKAAGLAETLSGKGPFTVFAPTNAAFAALPKGTLEMLLKPENRDLLRKVLNIVCRCMHYKFDTMRNKFVEKRRVRGS